MPQFVAQTLSQDGNVIASNFYIWINFAQRVALTCWDGNFTLPATSQFNPNCVTRTSIFKVQLNDGRSGDIIMNFRQSQTTGDWDIQFDSRGELA
jgi:hypothetical protein